MLPRCKKPYRRYAVTHAECVTDDTQTLALKMRSQMHWSSFRELDEKWKTRKGTVFLAFKRALPSLREGIDFIYLSHEQHASEIEQLRATERIYANSINAVLLAPEAITALGDRASSQHDDGD